MEGEATPSGNAMWGKTRDLSERNEGNPDSSMKYEQIVSSAVSQIVSVPRSVTGVGQPCKLQLATEARLNIDTSRLPWSEKEATKLRLRGKRVALAGASGAKNCHWLRIRRGRRSILGKAGG